MTSVTVQLGEQEIAALKQRTGKRNVEAALKAWVALANPQHTIAELRAALKESLKEESAAESKRFRRGRAAIRWLEN